MWAIILRSGRCIVINRPISLLLQHIKFILKVSLLFTNMLQFPDCECARVGVINAQNKI